MTTTTCSCGESRPHITARRKTADGISIEIWDNGAVTGKLGYKLEGVPIARPRTPSAVELERRTSSLFAGEVCIHNAADLGALHEACRWAAARDGLPGTVRARLAHRQSSRPTPVWTVVSADRDGNPTCRYWRLPRLLSAGTVLWDHVSVGASGGRYEIHRIRPGSHGETCDPSGIRFHRLSDAIDFILSERP